MPLSWRPRRRRVCRLRHESGTICRANRVSGSEPLTHEGVGTGERSPDDQLLDLARAFVERRHARVAEVLADRVLVYIAVAAVDLDGGVRGTDGRLARVVL